MGERGPTPKRSDQRRRRNIPTGGEPDQAEGFPVKVPSIPKDWHPVAKMWFRSLGSSGQSAFYQQSDWATAFVLAESISRELSPQPMIVGKGEDATVEMVSLPPKGASLAAWLKGFTALMVTEGDRRRLSLELTTPKTDEGEVANVSNLDEYKLRLAGPPA